MSFSEENPVEKIKESVEPRGVDVTCNLDGMYSDEVASVSGKKTHSVHPLICVYNERTISYTDEIL